MRRDRMKPCESTIQGISKPVHSLQTVYATRSNQVRPVDLWQQVITRRIGAVVPEMLCDVQATLKMAEKQPEDRLLRKQPSVNSITNCRSGIATDQEGSFGQPVWKQSVSCQNPQEGGFESGREYIAWLA